MFYLYEGDDARVVLYTINVQDDEKMAALETECGLTVSPISPAEVIMYDGGAKIVFNAYTGMLPNYTTIVAIKDDQGMLDNAKTLDVKLIMEPFTSGDMTRVERIQADLVIEPCPLCGKTAEEKSNDSQIEDKDEDEDEDGPVNRLKFYFDG